MIKGQPIEQMDAQICELLGLDQERLFWLKLEDGINYLNEWIGEDLPAQKEDMQRLPEFWDWWKQVWYIYDQNFMSLYADRGATLERYQMHHKVDKISFWPNSTIIRNYKRMKRKEPHTV